MTRATRRRASGAAAAAASATPARRGHSRAPAAAAEPKLSIGDQIFAKDRFDNWQTGVVVEARPHDDPSFKPVHHEAMRRQVARKRTAGLKLEGSDRAASDDAHLSSSSAAARTEAALLDAKSTNENAAAAAAAAVRLGSWVLVSTGGSAPEWLLYASRGPVCVAELGIPCICERHADADSDVGADDVDADVNVGRASRKRQRAAPRRTTPARKAASANRTPAQQSRPRKRRRATPQAGAYKEADDDEDDDGRFVYNDNQSSAEEYEEEDEEDDDDDDDDDDGDDNDDDDDDDEAVTPSMSDQEDNTSGRRTRHSARRTRADSSAKDGPREGEKSSSKEDSKDEENVPRDSSLMIDGHFSFNHDKLNLTSLKDYDEARDGEVTPQHIEDLRYRLHLPMADVFREAFLEGGQVNAAYCWMKLHHLHRPSIQDAGMRLKQWYVTHKDRNAPEGPPPNFGERMRDRRAASQGITPPPSKNRRRDRERERKLKRKRDRERDRTRDRKAERERRRERNAAGIRMNDLVPDLPLGVKLVGSKWEASVHLAPNVARTFVVGSYALSDDACKALELARKAISEHRAQMAVERKITLQEMERSGIASQCAVCHEHIDTSASSAPQSDGPAQSDVAMPSSATSATPQQQTTSTPVSSLPASADASADANVVAMEVEGVKSEANADAMEIDDGAGATPAPASVPVPAPAPAPAEPSGIANGHESEEASSAVVPPAQSIEAPLASQENDPSGEGPKPEASPSTTTAALTTASTSSPPAVKTWQGCDLCTRKYHVPACLDRQFESDEMAPRDPNCKTCSACLKLLLQLATEAARSIVPSGGGGRRASRRRADFDAADDSKSAVLGASPASRRLESDRPSFGFPVSKGFIKMPTAPRPKNKVLRRRDGVDLASRSQWLCEGFLDGGTRSRSRMYFTEFRYLDEPDVHYKLLDHVLLFRISPDGEEEDEDEDEEMEGKDTNVPGDEAGATSPTAGIARTPRSGGLQPASPSRKPVAAAGDSIASTNGTANGAANGSNGTTETSKASTPKGAGRKSSKATPDFYVGQIEAMWEETDGQRKARIAWFFWPEETLIPPDQVLQDEVFSSNEVDTVPLSSIAAKLLVLPYPAYLEHQKHGLSPYDTGIAGSVLTGRTVDAQVSGWVPPGVSTTGGVEDDGLVAETRSSSRRGADSSVAGTPARGGKNKTPAASTNSRAESPVGFKSSPATPGAASAMENQELEIGTRLRDKYRDKLLLARRVLFSRRHYHYRANKLVGTDHPSMETGSALNPWMHSFLLASFEKPDSSRLLSEKDQTSDRVCNYTLGIAESKSDPEVDTLHKIPGLQAMLDTAPQCSFCFENMPFVGHIKCAVCVGVNICFECFGLGRQGLVTANNNVRVLHRCSHPYRVAQPVLDYSNPSLAEEILSWMCTMYGLAVPEFSIVGIVRGPLPASEERAPSTRYRHAVTVEYGVARIKIKHSKSGQIARVLGSRFGKSIAESRGIVAVDALAAVFGVANKYTGPLLANEWSGGEAMRLVDSLEAHSLAWEPAEEVVGSKLALECAQYFTCYLHPAWAAESEWAEALRKLHEENEIPQGKATYVGTLPPAAPESVAAATRDASLWGEKVHQMTLRRSKIARRTKRGLAFAVVDGQTVFAKRPEAFAARVTDETDPILRNLGIDPASLVPSQAFVEGQRTAFSSLLHGTGRSVCAICDKLTGPDESKLVICDGCDSEFHSECLKPPLESSPDGDWFCPDCIADREYIYDHASWGQAGEALVRALSLTNAEDQKSQAWKHRALEWRDNNAVLEQATQAALAMGFTVSAAASTPRASKSPRPSTSSKSKSTRSAKKATTSSKKTARPSSKSRSSTAGDGGGGKSVQLKDDLQRASSSSSSQSSKSAVPAASSLASVPGSPPEAAEKEDPEGEKPPAEIFDLPPPPVIDPNATPGQALAAYVAHDRMVSGEGVPAGDDTQRSLGEHSIPKLEFFPREVLAASAWETRHFAAARVANLEASNHGLAEALHLVVAQRDALLALLHDKTEGKAKALDVEPRSHEESTANAPVSDPSA
ncbi:Lysine-specific demethylase 5B [Hondaea fermentalgiana]|uniref:Lysine-specific demethylase 5B n=1 Tax=Hondaea fermentalgiana TaxID=2315210 RepID=A0A2R5G5L8_9STRA|nr:Lysine-specific demethylase 5B [Hondaea fermentalgiana]|eukprot:GBG25068.1 Lysine-specific demethylase 5B [Hondaea fermentalgiana]